MLVRFFNTSLILSLLLFIFIYLAKGRGIEYNEALLLTNISHLVLFYYFIYKYDYAKKYSVKTLLVFSFLFNLLFVSIYSYLAFKETGMLFQFEPSDGPIYDEYGRWASKGGIITGILEVYNNSRYSFDDMGFIFYVSILYRIIDTPIIIKLVNIFINALSSYYLYNISRYYLGNRMAFLSTIIFSVSSFNIWFLFSGLKEPLMILLIIIVFYSYFKYYTTHKQVYIYKIILFSLLILFFRVPVFLFITGSITVAEIFRYGITTHKIVFISLLFLAIGFIYYAYNDYFTQYYNSFNPAYRDDDFSDEVNRSSYLSMPLSLFAGFFGPFPTLLPGSDFEDVSVYAPTLILKVFISPFFVVGVYFLWLKRNHFLISLAYFCLFQITSLTLLDQTYKLRYAYLHIPFIIIISFYAINHLSKFFNRYIFVRRVINFSYFLLAIFVFLWNYLRI